MQTLGIGVDIIDNFRIKIDKPVFNFYRLISDLWIYKSGGYAAH